MRSPTHSERAAHDAPADDLSRLLASEQAIATQLNRARAESEVIVQAAREEVARSEAAVVSTIAQKLSAVNVEYEATVVEDLRQIHAAALAIVSRFNNTTDDELHELAGFVLLRVLSLPAVPR